VKEMLLSRSHEAHSTEQNYASRKPYSSNFPLTYFHGRVRVKEFQFIRGDFTLFFSCILVTKHIFR